MPCPQIPCTQALLRGKLQTLTTGDHMTQNHALQATRFRTKAYATIGEMETWVREAAAVARTEELRFGTNERQGERLLLECLTSPDTSDDTTVVDRITVWLRPTSSGSVRVYVVPETERSAELARGLLSGLDDRIGREGALDAARLPGLPEIVRVIVAQRLETVAAFLDAWVEGHEGQKWAQISRSRILVPRPGAPSRMDESSRSLPGG